MKRPPDSSVPPEPLGAASSPALAALDLLVRRWNPPHRVPQPISEPNDVPLAVPQLGGIGGLHGAYLRGLDLSELADVELAGCDLRGCRDAASQSRRRDGRLPLANRLSDGQESPCLQSPRFALWAGHPSGVLTHLAATPNLRRVASGDRDGNIVLWQFDADGSSAVLARQKVSGGGVVGLALAGDGGLVVSAGAEGLVQVTDFLAPNTRSWQGKLVKPPTALAVDAAGDRIAILCQDAERGGQELSLLERQGSALDWQAKEITQSIKGISCIAFTANGRRLLIGTADGPLRMCELPDNGQPSRVWPLIETTSVQCLALDESGRRFAFSRTDGTIVGGVLNGDEARSIWSLSASRSSVLSLALGSDRDGMPWLAAVLEDGSLLTWWLGPIDDARTTGANAGPHSLPERSLARQPSRVAAHAGAARCVAIGSAPRLILTGGDDGRLVCWALPPPQRSLRAPRPIAHYGPSPAPVTGLALHPDGTRLITADSDGVMQVWTIDADFGLSTLGTQQRLGAAASAIALAPDGQRLASLNEEGEGRLWLLVDNGLVPLGAASFTTLGRGFGRIAWSPDGSTLGVVDGTDSLQRVHVGVDGATRSLEPLQLPGIPLFAIAWTEDGDPIAAGVGGLHRWRGKRHDGVDIGRQVTALARTGADLIASGDAFGDLRGWQVGGSGPMASTASPIELLKAPVSALAVSDDRLVLAAGDRSGGLALVLVGALAGKNGGAKLIDSHHRGINALAIGSNRRMLAVAGVDGEFSLLTVDDIDKGAWIRRTLSIGRGVLIRSPEDASHWHLERADGQRWQTQTVSGPDGAAEIRPCDPLLHEWLRFNDPSWGVVTSIDVPTSWLRLSDDWRLVHVSKGALVARQGNGE